VVQGARKSSKDGADVNAMEKRDGWSTLIRASDNGHIDSVCVLLENQADVNAVENDGFTALMENMVTLMLFVY
jgi:ankyrin repeat protein